METWLQKKRLNEAYKITQLRDVRKQTEIDDEAKLEMQRNAQPKDFKQWMMQKRMQQRFESMERARIA